VSLRLFALFAFSVLLPGTVWAREYTDLFPTPRGRALGGALTAFVDDWSSLSYNPAGLANIQGTQLLMPQLAAGAASNGTVEFYKKIQGFSGGSSVAEIASSLQDFDGEALGFDLDLLTMGWFKKRIALSVNPVSLQGSFRVRVPAALFAKVITRVTVDSGMTIGYAQPFLNNHLRAGFAFRPVIIRGGVSRSFVGTEIQSIDGSVLGVGWGYDADVGLQGNLDPIQIFGFDVQLMSGFTFQNIFASQFSQRITGSIGSAPPPLERRGALGFAAKIANVGIASPIIAIELRDLGVRTDTFLEHVHGCFEFALKTRPWFVSTIRGHFAKGNIGGGIAGRLWVGELEIGTFAVNLGKGAGVGRDRRTYVSLAAIW
jgi:hypothetical protein